MARMPFLAAWQAHIGVLRRLALLAAAALICNAATAADSDNFTTRAKAAVLMDADTGAILYQHSADELMPPASMSKLMTIAVVFRAIHDNRLKLDSEFTMSEHAWRTGGAPSRTTAMFVPINTAATINDLLQGMIVQSANDAAIAIAEGISGSEEAFAKRMTVEARRIGLTRSTFKNPTGFYDPQHLMSARELAMLARYIIKEYPDFYKLFSQKDFQYHKYRFVNRNPLLSAEIGADGLKAGSTKEAGFGLVGSAVQDGKRLIVVVMGLPSESQLKDESRKLLDWGFKGFAPFKVFETGEIVGNARVWGGERFFVPLTGNGPISVILPRVPPNPKLRAQIVYTGPLKPPIKKGDQVAKLRVTSPTNTVNEVPLYAAEDVEPGGIMRRGLDALAYLALGWVSLDRFLKHDT